MNNITIIKKVGLKRSRLTITPTEIRIKFPVTETPENIEKITTYFKSVIADLMPVNGTLRGDYYPADNSVKMRGDNVYKKFSF